MEDLIKQISVPHAVSAALCEHQEIFITYWLFLCVMNSITGKALRNLPYAEYQ
jgi:hypothetical protein